MKHLLQINHRNDLLNIIEALKAKFSLTQLIHTINNIDQEIPQQLLKHKIPNSRKEFIIKLITLRFEKIIALAK